jgi:hypothetical protein
VTIPTICEIYKDAGAKVATPDGRDEGPFNLLRCGISRA